MIQIDGNVKRYYDFWFGVNDAYDKLAKSKGITLNTWYILYIIVEYPQCCTLKFICEKLLLPKQTVHNVLVSLSDKGYLERKPQPQDKRNKLLALTPQGQAYADDILNMFANLEAQAFANLGPEKTAAFLDLTNDFYQELRALLPEQAGEVK